MLKKVQDIFVRTVNYVENRPSPFVRYYFLFAAILTIRLALEFFSSRRLFRLDDILHIGLWFIFIVLCFLILLHLFSGEKISKVAKLVIVFFSVALSAPIIDLLITGGMGLKMNYLSLHSWRNVAWSYITVGGSSLTRGATPGIRIEIILLVIASFNYVRTKRSSILKGLLAAITIYTVLFISGAVPALLTNFVSAFHLQYESDDQSTVLLLLSADIFLLMIALFRHSPRQVYELIKSVPWPAFLLGLLHVGIGITLALKNYLGNWHLTPTTLFWFPLLVMLSICLAGYTGLNNSLNTGNKNERLVKIMNGLLLIVIIISSMIGAKTLFTSLLVWAILFLLNDPVLELKRIPVLRSLLHSLIFLAAAFVGFCTFGAPMIGFPTTWLFIILSGAFIGGIFSELGSINGIFPDNIKTKPVSKLICSVLLIFVFVYTDRLLLGRSTLHLFFLLTVIPPILMVWFIPTKTQYIILSLVPAYILLLINNLM